MLVAFKGPEQRVILHGKADSGIIASLEQIKSWLIV